MGIQSHVWFVCQVQTTELSVSTAAVKNWTVVVWIVVYLFEINLLTLNSFELRLSLTSEHGRSGEEQWKSSSWCTKWTPQRNDYVAEEDYDGHCKYQIYEKLS